MGKSEKPKVEKAIKLDKKTTKIILIAVVAVVVLGIGIFLLTRNLQQETGNTSPEADDLQVTLKDSQLNAILLSSDSSEPVDTATTLDPDVVDSTGLG